MGDEVKLANTPVNFVHSFGSAEDNFPSDYFLGAQYRPKLEILKPENGQILDYTTLEIKIKISGYDSTSLFHDTRICISLSSESTGTEQCFERTPDLVYHVDNLTPTKQYSLRVAFFERGNAIAVSVRSFVVGGVTGLLEGSDTPVAIRTAVQMAIKLHEKNMKTEAEQIYRKVLEASPAHQDTLHMLGVIFYQKGDPGSAVPYIESALKVGRTDESLHNSLGECYRMLGRLKEAEEQFREAQRINPRYLVAGYNEGLAQQEAGRWIDALETFARVSRNAPTLLGELTPKEWEQNKLRECDLLQVLGRRTEAHKCWEESVALFPTSHSMLNELATVLGQEGDYPAALILYRRAVALGSSVAELNLAHLLELEGFYEESRQWYIDALTHVSKSGLPAFHIRVRLAAVLPRIMPASDTAIEYTRQQLSNDLDALLAADSVTVTVDNTPPIYFGYSHGHQLAFHGLNDVALKSRLARVYLRMCPALNTGVFIETARNPPNAVEADRAILSALKKDAETIVESSDGCSANNNNSSIALTTQLRPLTIGILSRHIRQGHVVGPLVHGLIDTLSMISGLKILLMHIGAGEGEELPVNRRPDDPIRLIVDKTVLKMNGRVVNLPPDMNMIAASVRAASIDILLYPEIGSDPVTYFLGFSRLAPVQACWLAHPDTTGIPAMDYFVGSDIEPLSAQSFYSESLIRMRGLGTVFSNPFPQSSSQTISVSPGSSTRGSLLARQSLTERLGLPRAAHLYLVAQPLSHLHVKFDGVLSRLLLQDRLGYILIVEETVARRQAWQELFVTRLAGGFSQEIRSRIVFYSPETMDGWVEALAGAHVMLDPFPVSILLPSLQAICTGLPVITFPSDRLGGRLTLALYQELDYGLPQSESMNINKKSRVSRKSKPLVVSGTGETTTAGTDTLGESLVVSSVAEYVAVVLAIAHKPKLREQHAEQLILRRQRLFSDDLRHRATEDWAIFFRNVTGRSIEIKRN